MAKLSGGFVRCDGMIGGSRILGTRRLRAEAVAPRRISRASLVNNYLCMGRHSPCHRCEVLCYYGRMYLDLKAKGTKTHG